MRRLFWVALGAAAGVAIVRQVTKKAEALTPSGIGRSVSRLGDTFRAFAEDVRAGMAEREQELEAALHDERVANSEVVRHLVSEGPGSREAPVESFPRAPESPGERDRLLTGGRGVAESEPEREGGRR